MAEKRKRHERQLNSPLNGADPSGAEVFVGGVPSFGQPGPNSGWRKIPGGFFDPGAGSADGNAVMIAGLNAVSSGNNGDLLAAFLADTSYVDLNFSYSFGLSYYYLGITGGVQFTNSGYYPYGGGGIIGPAGRGAALTLGNDATPGAQVGFQFGAGGFSAQGGYAWGSGWFLEGGVGTFGAALTGYYVFGPFNY